jgi:hypothetical protein
MNQGEIHELGNQKKLEAQHCRRGREKEIGRDRDHNFRKR